MAGAAALKTDLKKVQAEIQKYETKIFKGIWNCVLEIVLDGEKIKVLCVRLNQRREYDTMLIKDTTMAVFKYIDSLLSTLKNLNNIGLIRTAQAIHNGSGQIITYTELLIKNVQYLQRSSRVIILKLDTPALAETKQIIAYATRMNKIAERLNKLCKQI